jgi:type I restriction enzyme S subunit
MNDLPEGWVETKLSSLILAGPQNGLYKPQTAYGAGASIVRIDDFHDGHLLRGWNALRRLSVTKSELETYGLREGDLLINRVNSAKFVGKPLLVEGLDTPAVFESNMMRLSFKAACADPRFILLVLLSPEGRSELQKNVKHAVNQSSINQHDVREVECRLPPLPEQRRIVEKIEALLEQVNRAKGRLERVPLLLKRFRQAVLAAACSGLLSGEDGNVEGPYEFLPSLPSGWRWLTAEEVCERVVDCHNKTAPYAASGIRLLRTTNIRGGGLVLDDARYVTPETYKFWSRRCPPQPGDVLFTREAPMGEAALIPPGMTVCMGQRMMLLRANPNIIDKEFLLLAVQGPHVMKYAEHVAVGSGVLHMRVGDVERLPIPVPPLAVQRSIVEETTLLLGLADRVARRARAAQDRAEKLPQAILSKAFSGELVPTEVELARAEGRTYETAEELLARVTASRDEAKGVAVAPRMAPRKRRRGSQGAEA